MFKINEFVVYKRDVCRVKEIKQNYLNGIDYYVLTPIDDASLTIEIPMDNKLGFIRKIISKDDVERIISTIKDVDIIIVDNERAYEQIYKDLLKGNHLDLIKIIKTTYLKNENRFLNNKKISEKDDIYFKKAEKILYNEFSIALNMSYNETKNYVYNKVRENM